MNSPKKVMTKFSFRCIINIVHSTNNTHGSTTFNIQVKSNGFECLDASGNIFMSVKYNADSDRLSFNMAKADGGTAEYIMVKGTTDLSAATA